MCASPSASAATPPIPAAAAAKARSRSRPLTTTLRPFATRLWNATDEAYKNALRAYSAKQAALKRFQTPPTEKDFAPAKPVTHIGPLVSLDIDRKEWVRRIVEASGLYATDPEVSSFAADVQYSTANVRGLAVNRYLVNTEGTAVRQGYSGYAASINVGGQAADGMELTRENGTVGVTAKELESWPAFRKRVIANIKSLEALRNAPVVSSEDYHGPVLFSGDAAADVMDRLFIPNVEATRPEMGTTARTQGAYTSSFHARVLPDFLSATDDPLTDHLRRPPAARRLCGRRRRRARPAGQRGSSTASWRTTSSAARPSATSLSRTATAAPPWVRPPARSSGVMIFKSGRSLQRRRHECAPARHGQGPGPRCLRRGDARWPSLAPRLLYLVHPDGSRQLVRGAVFDELDNRSLRSDIIAAGDDEYVDNSLGIVPTTTIAPSLLFDDIGVKRATVEQQKLPYYAPPEPPAQ